MMDKKWKQIYICIYIYIMSHQMERIMERAARTAFFFLWEGGILGLIPEGFQHEGPRYGVTRAL